MERDSLEKLLGLFNLGRKREIERYCQNLIITSEDFAKVLLASRITGLGPYRYACHFREITPDELKLRENELTSLGKSEPGPLKGDALKSVRKIDQMFRDRRLLSVHLFYTHSQNYWHMFYFDQRDYQSSRNHWKHGPHIHYSHDSFTKVSLNDIWSLIVAEKPVFPPSIHIRYDYHHNRLKK